MDLSPTAEAFDEDARLVEKAQAGDTDALSRLVAEHQNRVRKVALEILGSPDEADEVMVDVLARLPETIRLFQGKSKFSTWLYQVARNRAISELRRRQRTEELEDEEASSPSGESKGVEIDLYLDAALGDLPPRDRQILLLRGEGFSHREIADRLGGTESGVKTRYHRLKRRLSARHRSHT